MRKFLSVVLCTSLLFAFVVPTVQNNEENYGISTCAIFDEEDEYYSGPNFEPLP